MSVFENDATCNALAWRYKGIATMGRMSRKRFCKLLMANGWSRNKAQAIALLMKDTPGGYAAAYKQVAHVSPEMIARAALLAGDVMKVVSSAFAELAAAVAKTVANISEWAEQVNAALNASDKVGPDGH